MKILLALLCVLVWAGCNTPERPTTSSIYPREAKTIERTIEVDLGDGRKGTLEYSEVDIEDYKDLIDSVQFNHLDEAPVPVLVPSPRYPADLLKRGVEGSAEVIFIINEVGMVDSIRVKSATHRQFGEAAVAAVIYWKFEPMTKNGKPTKVAFRQVFPFQLD